jgi:hypothetical protein
MTSRLKRTLFGISGIAAAAACVAGITWAGRSPKEVMRSGNEAPAPPASVAEHGAPAAPAPMNRASAAALALKPLFNALDCERGGVIRPNEVDEHMAQVLGIYDRDGSRTISRAEYLRTDEGVARERRAALFDASDTTPDGVLSAKEFSRHIVALMDAVDANRDGEVTRLELDRETGAPTESR